MFFSVLNYNIKLHITIHNIEKKTQQQRCCITLAVCLCSHKKNILCLPGFVFKMQPLAFNVRATHISHPNINMQLSTDHKSGSACPGARCPIHLSARDAWINHHSHGWLFYEQPVSDLTFRSVTTPARFLSLAETIEAQTRTAVTKNDMRGERMQRRSQRKRHLQRVRNAMMHIPVQLMQCDWLAKIFHMQCAFNCKSLTVINPREEENYTLNYRAHVLHANIISCNNCTSTWTM